MAPPQVIVPGSAAAQRARFAAAFSLLERAIADRAFPGAALGVFAGDEVAVLDGVGRFTYAADSTEVTASTVYDLASLTKVLATTAMAMLLSQRGRVDLDQPLTSLLPAFAAGEPDGGPRHRVTLRMLLAHCSGLAGYARLFETEPDAGSLFHACLHLPLEAEPGTRAEYSDLGFILLGRALEMAAGEPLHLFCAREVFAPLGMSSTCFRPPLEWRAFIPPTEDDRTFRRRILQGEVQDENCAVLGGIGGHAGLFSNALDPLLFARCLLRGGAPLFNPDTIRRFTARSGMPPGSSRALGWDTPSPPSSSGRLFSPRSAGHLGYAGTSLWIDFERGIAIVLLTNRTWPDRTAQGIRELRPALHDAVMGILLPSQ